MLTHAEYSEQVEHASVVAQERAMSLINHLFHQDQNQNRLRVQRRDLIVVQLTRIDAIV